MVLDFIETIKIINKIKDYIKISNMYKNKTIAAVIPFCYNEETQLMKVISSMPEFIDHLIIIDDASTDNTAEIAIKQMQHNNKIFLLNIKKTKVGEYSLRLQMGAR